MFDTILTKRGFSVGNWRKFAFKGKQQFTEAAGVAISENSKTLYITHNNGNVILYTY